MFFAEGYEQRAKCDAFLRAAHFPRNNSTCGAAPKESWMSNKDVVISVICDPNLCLYRFVLLLTFEKGRITADSCEV